jgi:hypothetical protein
MRNGSATLIIKILNAYSRVAESFKWAYALRTELGDPSDPDITDLINEVSSLKGRAHEIIVMESL